MGFFVFVVSIFCWIIFLGEALNWGRGKETEWNHKTRQYVEKEKNDNGSVMLIFGLTGLGTTAGWVWLGRSALQWFFFGVIYMNITFWIWTLCLIILAVLVWRAGFAGALGIMWFISMIVFASWWPAIAKVYTFESLKYEKITALPETTEVRYLPLDVAERLGQNQFQDSKYYLGDIDPIMYEGDFAYIFPKVPNGFWNSALGKANGFAIVHSDGQLAHLPPNGQEMKYGEGMIFSDAISWKLREAKYWAETTEVYYLWDPQNKEIVALSPYIEYFYRFPVRVPRWGGVLVVRPNGEIHDFTPEQAQALPYVQGQRIFPEKLALLFAESWEYKDGIANAWWGHNDQIQIPRVDHSSNQMPYLLPTTFGPKWFVAAEPWGRSGGILKMFFFDAHTGALEVVELPKESGLIGPNRAWEYAKAAFKEVKWGDMTLLEPRPVINRGKLYWMLSIVPAERGAITETVLVDAEKMDSERTRSLSFGSRNALMAALQKGLPEAAKLEQKMEERTVSASSSAPAGVDEILAEIERIQRQLDALYKKVSQMK